MIAIRLSPKAAPGTRADTRVLFVSEGRSVPREEAGTHRAALARALRTENFGGREGESVLWHSPNGGPRLLVMGAGRAEDVDLETVRRLFATTARRLEKNSAHFTAVLPAAGRGDLTTAGIVQAATEGVLLGSHRWDAWITSPKHPGNGGARRLRRVTLLGLAGTAEREALRRGTVAARATLLARDLVSEAPSVLTPRAMAGHARRVARQSGLSITVLDERRAQQLGMGCFLGVARGSDELV